jgi:hypothetical protein
VATNTEYRVTYCFELNGKRCSETFQDNVLAADQNYNTIKTILTNNGRTNNGIGTLKIEGIGHFGGSPSTLLS